MRLNTFTPLILCHTSVFVHHILIDFLLGKVADLNVDITLGPRYCNYIHRYHTTFHLQFREPWFPFPKESSNRLFDVLSLAHK
jgi:hypothetical protein